MRRVVTGNNADGKAIFVSDGDVERLVTESGPSGVHLVWGWDSAPVVPTDGTKPSYERWFPALGAMRVLVIEGGPTEDDPAETEHESDLDDALDEETGLRSDAEWDDADPAMHRSRTVDVGLVLEGSVVLELDDGVQKVLRAGDWFVQNGTWHAWRPNGRDGSKIAFFVVGAESAF